MDSTWVRGGRPLSSSCPRSGGHGEKEAGTVLATQIQLDFTVVDLPILYLQHFKTKVVSWKDIFVLNQLADNTNAEQ